MSFSLIKLIYFFFQHYIISIYIYNNLLRDCLATQQNMLIICVKCNNFSVRIVCILEKIENCTFRRYELFNNFVLLKSKIAEIVNHTIGYMISEVNYRHKTCASVSRNQVFLQEYHMIPYNRY